MTGESEREGMLSLKEVLKEELQSLRQIMCVAKNAFLFYGVDEKWEVFHVERQTR